MAMPRLLERYRNEVVPAMKKEFGYENVMQVPRIEKVVLNIGMGEALQNAKSLGCRRGRPDDHRRPEAGLHQGEEVDRDLQAARGQHHRRDGDAAQERMWSFLDRLMNIALPRQRDFRGISPGFVRRPWQLQPGPARTADLARDPVRQDRQGARHGGDHRDDGARPTKKAAGCLRCWVCRSGSKPGESQEDIRGEDVYADPRTAPQVRGARAQPLQHLRPAAWLHAPV